MDINSSKGVHIALDSDASLRDGVSLGLWKKFDPADVGCIRRFEREAAFFERCDSIPHIPGSIEIDRPNYRIRRAFIRGDSLNAYHNNLSLKDSARALLSLAEMLRATHKKDMIYCDVKPANMIRNDDGNEFTVVDFDGVEILPSGKDYVRGLCRGTFPYFAPERLMDAQAFCTTQSDSFGLGILAYYIIKDANLPYEGGFLPQSTEPTKLARWENEMKNRVVSYDAAPLRSGCRDLDRIIKLCVSRDRSKRPGDDELVFALASIAEKYK
jgi:serine/threonine protein kinase